MLHHDPNWPRASAWLAGEFSKGAPGLTVFGAPLNASISLGRCDLAPAAIRVALQRYSTADLVNGVDLMGLSVRDLGDLDLGDQRPETSAQPISDKLVEALAQVPTTIILGGDNGITRPGVLGLAKALGIELSEVGLVTLDAHLDLRHLDNGLHNGNPIRALLADGLPGENIAQLGIQPFSNSVAYDRVALEAGIHGVGIDEIHEKGMDTVLKRQLEELSKTVKAIYVDFDIDVVDRAFVPATPGSRPGGITPWQARQAACIAGLHPLVRVIDFVEIDPTHDVADVTCLLAAACLLSFASGVMRR